MLGLDLPAKGPEEIGIGRVAHERASAPSVTSVVER